MSQLSNTGKGTQQPAQRFPSDFYYFSPDFSVSGYTFGYNYILSALAKLMESVGFESLKGS
jgi:hypothetical protein